MIQAPPKTDTPEFKLEVSAQGETEILLTRQFRAPRELVFRCFTEPALIVQWVCCGKGTTTESTFDGVIGGNWTHKMIMSEGSLFVTFGQVLEFERPNRVVRSYIFDVPIIREQVSSETTSFSEEDGVTTVTILIRHLCRENRDGHLQSGLSEGARSSYDALHTLLQQMS
jgi:uncharacterized protein YndB with AHSA1/START domain